MNDACMIRSVQIKIVELTDAGVIEIDMNDGIIVGRLQGCNGGTKREKPVDDLCI